MKAQRKEQAIIRIANAELRGDEGGEIEEQFNPEDILLSWDCPICHYAAWKGEPPPPHEHHYD